MSFNCNAVLQRKAAQLSDKADKIEQALNSAGERLARQTSIASRERRKFENLRQSAMMSRFDCARGGISLQSFEARIYKLRRSGKRLHFEERLSGEFKRRRTVQMSELARCKAQLDCLHRKLEEGRRRGQQRKENFCFEELGRTLLIGRMQTNAKSPLSREIMPATHLGGGIFNQPWASAPSSLGSAPSSACWDGAPAAVCAEMAERIHRVVTQSAPDFVRTKFTYRSVSGLEFRISIHRSAAGDLSIRIAVADQRRLAVLQKEKEKLRDALRQAGHRTSQILMTRALMG